MNLDFEKIANEFQLYFRIKSISHCDFVDVVNDEVAMVEMTRYINKNLLDRNIYEAEVVEIVKKMWGSLTIAVWYWNENPELLSKEKFFVLKVQVKPGFERILAQLIKDVRKFKDGAYDEVKMEIVDNGQ